ncbi:hypothetical protein KY290_013467 [Solanum tuberosum]|uniref:Uncharacterized protein n=1 Tax=Solanum tuberosum TaxID=4113 RepID=A0ABQ7VN33_SOLTU|nr:hypothetical protein KY290_013467 [Solanum tuberosum]
MTDSIRITRGIPNNFKILENFLHCITQGLLENVGFTARMAQESSSKKRRLMCSENPDVQVKDRIDGELQQGDEEAR